MKINNINNKYFNKKLAAGVLAFTLVASSLTGCVNYLKYDVKDNQYTISSYIKYFYFHDVKNVI